MDKFIMSNKEREQAKIFELVKTGLISKQEAAQRLRISDRWVRKKIKRYMEKGDLGIIHQNRNKVSPRRWNETQKQAAIERLQSKEWDDFGPTFATEKLEQFGIKASRETIRQIMIEMNIWKVKRQKSKHRKRRERRSMLGMMVQLDGSPHDWFEGRANKCTLLVFIDDATSQILWLEFAPSESKIALMQATKNYVQAKGIPQSFYVDHGGVFHVNLNNQENDKKTEWEQSCDKLGIKVHHATSPQAKGRVERCNQTMQDRLIKEMRLIKISSIEAANQYLQTSDFIKNHNNKFAVKPAQQGDAHADYKSYNLDNIFSMYETRILANDFTIKYQAKIYQLHEQRRAFIKPKDEITIKTSLKGVMSLWIRKTQLEFNEIIERPRKIKEPRIINSCKQYKPSENSRRWVSGSFFRRVG